MNLEIYRLNFVLKCMTNVNLYVIKQVFFQVFLFICHTITLLKDAKRKKKKKNVGRDGEEA